MIYLQQSNYADICDRKSPQKSSHFCKMVSINLAFCALWLFEALYQSLPIVLESVNHEAFEIFFITSRQRFFRLMIFGSGYL
jgi:hypothetical protein